MECSWETKRKKIIEKKKKKIEKRKKEKKD